VKNVDKLAAVDAFNWARAEMFFGEGAGTRRKLLNAAIAQKATSIPGYEEAFERAYAAQDMAKHAIKAAQERQHIDRSNAIGKNVKGILRGDRRSMSTGVLVLVGVAYILHQTGYDKVLYAEGQKYYRKLKAEYKARQFATNIKTKFKE
jgi:hypothetical protein